MPFLGKSNAILSLLALVTTFVFLFCWRSDSVVILVLASKQNQLQNRKICSIN